MYLFSITAYKEKDKHSTKGRLQIARERDRDRDRDSHVLLDARDIFFFF